MKKCWWCGQELAEDNETNFCNEDCETEYNEEQELDDLVVDEDFEEE